MGTKKNPVVLWLSYPLTWLVLAIIVAAHTGFYLWFRPGMMLQLLAFGADLAGIILWFILAFQSKAFRGRLNRMPFEDSQKEIKSILNKCPAQFREPARQCLSLIDKIRKDFHSSEYEGELGQITASIKHLASNHYRLHNRSVNFGTSEQKQSMQDILTRQENSIQTTLKTLKTFGGNLALLDANTTGSGASSEELKYINDGLQDVIKEFENE